MNTDLHQRPAARRTRFAALARLCAAVGLACAMLGTATMAPAAPSTASRFYEDALVRFEQGDFQGASIQLRNALQADKSLLPAHVLMGRVMLALSDVAGAEAALAGALKLGVSRAEVAVPLARSIMLQGRPKDLLKDPRFELAGLPPSVQMQLLLMRAQAASDLDESRTALRAIEEARAIDPTAVEPWLAEVPVRIRSRQFPEALAAAARAVSMRPESAEPQYQRGSIQHVQGDRRAALASYAKAIEFDGRHVEAHLARASLLVDMAHPDALAAVKGVTTRWPKEPRGIYLRAIIAGRAGDVPAKVAALREVTGLLDPMPPDMLRYRSQLLMVNGLAHHDLGEPEKAKPLLEMFQRSQPGSPVAKLLAQQYLAERQPDPAIAVLETYLRSQPGDTHAVALLASAHLARGRHARATSLMQEALRTKDDTELHVVLGLSQWRAGNLDTALASLETAYRRNPKQVQSGSALAMLLLQSGEPVKALTIAQALAKAHPQHAGVANLNGLARRTQGDLAGARAAFERAQQLDANLSEARVNLARLDMGERKFDQAADRLLAVLKVDQNHVDAMQEMSRLEELRGRGEAAQEWLQKASAVDGPKGLRAGLALVDLHLRTTRYEAAKDVARKLSSAHADNVAVLVALARTELALRDLAAARATLTQASRLANFDPAMQVEIAGLQVLAGHLPGASYSVDKALSAQPGHLPAQVLQAELLAREGQYAKSDLQLRGILKAHPRSAVAHHVQGTSYMARGQAGPAIEAFRKAYQAAPSGVTFFALFDALVAQDRAAALALGQQWIQSRPKDTKVRHALAELHVRAGNLRPAATAYEDIIRLSPNDASALNNLANVQIRLNERAALATAERALALQPANAVVLDTVGWAAHQAGQHDRALQFLREARLRNPSLPTIRFHLATVLARMGRQAEARDELNEALKSGHRFDGEAEAQALLRTLK